MYDEAPCHRAEITKGFFETKGITLIKWLACSPDLNSIENIWSRLKRGINNRDTISKTREELIQAIQEE